MSQKKSSQGLYIGVRNQLEANTRRQLKKLTCEEPARTQTHRKYLKTSYVHTSNIDLLHNKVKLLPNISVFYFDVILFIKINLNFHFQLYFYFEFFHFLLTNHEAFGDVTLSSVTLRLFSLLTPRLVNLWATQLRDAAQIIPVHLGEHRKKKEERFEKKDWNQEFMSNQRQL